MTERNRKTEGGAAVTDEVTVRAREVLGFAQRLLDQSPHWMVVFREVFGPNGIAREYFPTAEEMMRFERTPEYRAVQALIAQVREQSEEKDDARAATRMITVRIPKVLHESLREEAHQRKTSMNKLCIWKLFQALDERNMEVDSSPS